MAGMGRRESFPVRTWARAGAEALSAEREAGEPRKRKGHEGGRTAMKCSRMGARTGCGRSSMRRASLEALSGGEA